MTTIMISSQKHVDRKANTTSMQTVVSQRRSNWNWNYDYECDGAVKERVRRIKEVSIYTFLGITDYCIQRTYGAEISARKAERLTMCLTAKHA
jgi:hypothetical protein